MDDNKKDLEELLNSIKNQKAFLAPAVLEVTEPERAVPFFVYETEVARNERTTKRLIIALIIAIILLFLSNAAWLYAWTRYDYESEEITYTQDGEGFNNINTGEQGDVNGPKRNNQEAEP